MRINKKTLSLLIKVLLFMVILIVSVIIFNTPVKKEDLYGKYRVLFSGINWQFDSNYYYREIDDIKFYSSLGKNIIADYSYTFDGKFITYWNAGYEKIIKRWFSDEVESTQYVKYRVIKIGNCVILLGGESDYIIIKINKQTTPKEE